MAVNVNFATTALKNFNGSMTIDNLNEVASRLLGIGNAGADGAAITNLVNAINQLNDPEIVTQSTTLITSSALDADFKTELTPLRDLFISQAPLSKTGSATLFFNNFNSVKTVSAYNLIRSGRYTPQGLGATQSNFSALINSDAWRAVDQYNNASAILDSGVFSAYPKLVEGLTSYRNFFDTRNMPTFDRVPISILAFREFNGSKRRNGLNTLLNNIDYMSFPTYAEIVAKNNLKASMSLFRSSANIKTYVQPMVSSTVFANHPDWTPTISAFDAFFTNTGSLTNIPLLHILINEFNSNRTLTNLKAIADFLPNIGGLLGTALSDLNGVRHYINTYDSANLITVATNLSSSGEFAPYSSLLSAFSTAINQFTSSSTATNTYFSVLAINDFLNGNSFPKLAAIKDTLGAIGNLSGADLTARNALMDAIQTFNEAGIVTHSSTLGTSSALPGQLKTVLSTFRNNFTVPNGSTITRVPFLVIAIAQFMNDFSFDNLESVKAALNNLGNLSGADSTNRNALVAAIETSNAAGIATNLTSLVSNPSVLAQYQSLVNIRPSFSDFFATPSGNPLTGVPFYIIALAMFGKNKTRTNLTAIAPKLANITGFTTSELVGRDALINAINANPFSHPNLRTAISGFQWIGPLLAYFRYLPNYESLIQFFVMQPFSFKLSTLAINAYLNSKTLPNLANIATELSLARSADGNYELQGLDLTNRNALVTAIQANIPADIVTASNNLLSSQIALAEIDFSFALWSFADSFSQQNTPVAVTPTLNPAIAAYIASPTTETLTAVVTALNALTSLGPDASAMTSFAGSINPLNYANVLTSSTTLLTSTTLSESLKSSVTTLLVALISNRSETVNRDYNTFNISSLNTIVYPDLLPDFVPRFIAPSNYKCKFYISATDLTMNVYGWRANQNFLTGATYTPTGGTPKTVGPNDSLLHILGVSQNPKNKLNDSISMDLLISSDPHNGTPRDFSTYTSPYQNSKQLSQGYYNTGLKTLQNMTGAKVKDALLVPDVSNNIPNPTLGVFKAGDILLLYVDGYYVMNNNDVYNTYHTLYAIQIEVTNDSTLLTNVVNNESSYTALYQENDNSMYPVNFGNNLPYPNVYLSGISEYDTGVTQANNTVDGELFKYYIGNPLWKNYSS
jgi:hypothetical protein